MRLLGRFFSARPSNTRRWKVERYVACLPWINEVFPRGYWFLDFWSWFAPKIFRSYQGVLGRHIRRTHHRYHERLYEVADSVISTRFQRGSLSTRFFCCRFPLFQGSPLLCLLPWNIALTLWVSSRCSFNGIRLFTVLQGIYVQCHNGVLLCHRFALFYRSSSSHLFCFVGIGLTLLPPRQSFLTFPAMWSVIVLYFVCHLRMGGGDWCETKRSGVA